MISAKLLYKKIKVEKIDNYYLDLLSYIFILNYYPTLDI
jgi:hypothetical protein